MTMTTEKLAELKRLAEKALQDGLFSYANPQTILSLIALAERALQPEDLRVAIKDCADEQFAELGRIAMRFVDRAGDVHPGIDDAERICREFHQAMADAIDARFEGRALQPEEGQAHEENCATLLGSSMRGPCDCTLSAGLPELPDAPMLGGDPDYGDAMYGFTANQMGAYGRKCYDAGRASQLALPAGPVPEGAVISRRLLLKAIQAINYHLEPESPEEHEQTMKELGALLDRSPAVAQPVADEDSKRLDYLETLRQESATKGFKWNTFPYDTDRPIRVTIDVARTALTEANRD